MAIRTQQIYNLPKHALEYIDSEADLEVSGRKMQYTKMISAKIPSNIEQVWAIHPELIWRLMDS